MKLTIFANLLLISISILLTVDGAITRSSRHEMHARFQQWKEHQGKWYESPAVEHQRFEVWLENLAVINAHNLLYDFGLRSFRMGLNQFSDLTQQEFKSQFLANQYTRPDQKRPLVSMNSDANLPKQVNWTEHGWVTPVENQDDCGSCYSFSAAGAIEGQWKNVSGNLIVLSKQQAVDCSREYHNLGCQGGNMVYVYQYAMKVGGLMTEKAYPYSGEDMQRCRFKKAKAVAKVESFAELDQSENTLLSAVATVGPIACAINAGPEIQHYSSGVFSSPNCDGQMINHAILVTGYGAETRTGQPFWSIKNSWGPEWGENGYVRLAKDAGNMCGIASMCSFPIAPKLNNDDDEEDDFFY